MSDEEPSPSNSSPEPSPPLAEADPGQRDSVWERLADRTGEAVVSDGLGCCLEMFGLLAGAAFAIIAGAALAIHAVAVRLL